LLAAAFGFRTSSFDMRVEHRLRIVAGLLDPSTFTGQDTNNAACRHQIASLERAAQFAAGAQPSLLVEARWQQEFARHATGT
jgi:hypothetical protein